MRVDGSTGEGAELFQSHDGDVILSPQLSPVGGQWVVVLPTAEDHTTHSAYVRTGARGGEGGGKVKDMTEVLKTLQVAFGWRL